jgi:hypothetical protein
MSGSRRTFHRAARDVKLSDKNQQQQLFDDVHAAIGRLNRANSGASLVAASPTPDAPSSLASAGQTHDFEHDDRDREQTAGVEVTAAPGPSSSPGYQSGYCHSH